MVLSSNRPHTPPLSKVVVVPLVANFSVVHHSHHRSSTTCCAATVAVAAPVLCSHQRMKSRCHWGTCCTWPITLVILAQMKLAVRCCINLKPRVRQGVAHVAGIVARLLSPMIAGVHGVRPSAKWALLSAKFVVYGVFCSLSSSCAVAYVFNGGERSMIGVQGEPIPRHCPRCGGLW